MSTVFFDVDTQLDFLYPAGSLYVPGAEKIVPALARLTAYAAQHGIPIVSTMDAHTGPDPEFKTWPHHCVTGCLGQRKPEGTLTSNQHFVPKQHTDCFTNPDLPALLQSLNAERYVVYGVVTEVCVRHAVLGLLATGKPVTVLTDAVKELNVANGQLVFDEFVRAGALLGTSFGVLVDG